MITAKNIHRSDQRDQRGSLAVLLFIFIALGALGITFYNPKDKSFVTWDMLGMTLRPASGFEMARVSFGMTPSMVRRLHPNHKAGSDAHGRTIMSFSYDGADYTVWFMDQKNSQQAYRVRFTRMIENGDEEQLLSLLGERYGRPNSGQCETRIISDARDCLYTWRANAIDIQAMVQAPPPVAPSGTIGLVLTAENIELAAQIENDQPRL